MITDLLTYKLTNLLSYLLTYADSGPWLETKLFDIYADLSSG